MTITRNLQSKMFWIFSVATLLALSGCRPEELKIMDAPAIKRVRKVIVLPLTDAPGEKTFGSGKVARGGIIEELLHVKRFQIRNISSKNLAEALKDVGFVESECYDPAVAAEMGKKFQADTVICGELMQYASRLESEKHTVMFVEGGGTHTDHLVGMNIRIVRTEDGKIIYAGYGCGRSEKGYQQASEIACKMALKSARELFKKK